MGRHVADDRPRELSRPLAAISSPYCEHGSGMGARRRSCRILRLCDWHVQRGEHEPRTASQVPATRRTCHRARSRLARLLDRFAVVLGVCGERVSSEWQRVDAATARTLPATFRSSVGWAVRARRRLCGIHRNAVRRGLWNDHADRRRRSIQAQGPPDRRRTLRRRWTCLLGRHHRLRG